MFIVRYDGGEKGSEPAEKAAIRALNTGDVIINNITEVYEDSVYIVDTNYKELWCEYMYVYPVAEGEEGPEDPPPNYIKVFTIRD